MSKIIAANQSSIEKAAAIVRAGGLVGMPTETVYGLAANALDGRAVARVFEAKGRPSFNPLITHFAKAGDIEPYGAMNDHAKALAQAFWPGPLTLIVPSITGNDLSDLVTAGLPSIAVRVPDHDVARSFIAAAGVPIAAPSANMSGRLSPTNPAHVAEGLGDHLDMVLAAGASAVGLESTVVDVTTDTPVILRPGGITAEAISEALGMDIGYADAGGKIKSPGQLLKHYAPDTPVRLNAVDLRAGEALLAFGSIKFMGIQGGGAAADLPDSMVRNLSENQDLHEAAANLFAMMRELDKPEHTAIAVMNMPSTGLGAAINDRLKRAASGT